MFLGPGRVRLGLVVHAGADVLLPRHGVPAAPDRLHDALLAVDILRRACLLARVVLARRFCSEAGHEVANENRRGYGREEERVKDYVISGVADLNYSKLLWCVFYQ